MADLIKQLYKKNDSSTKIFPNIKSENIPSSSVSLAKLTNDIKRTLQDVSNKLDATKLDSLLASIKTNLSLYGVDFTYSYSNDEWTISFANVEQEFECTYAYDITQHFVKYQKVDNHYFGYLNIEINEQILADDELLRLDNQDEFPIVDMFMNGWKNGSPCVVKIDTDGIVSTNVGLDEYDVLTIRLDWWV